MIFYINSDIINPSYTKGKSDMFFEALFELLGVFNAILFFAGILGIILALIPGTSPMGAGLLALMRIVYILRIIIMFANGHFIISSLIYLIVDIVILALFANPNTNKTGTVLLVVDETSSIIMTIVNVIRFMQGTL